MIIGSDNGLSPARRQAITWTNAGILLIGPLGKHQWNLNQNLYIFVQENGFENVVWKMVAILSLPQCVNYDYFWVAEQHGYYFAGNIFKYRKTSSISRTKSQNLNVSCFLLQRSLPNPLKPGVKLRMKM